MKNPVIIFWSVFYLNIIEQGFHSFFMLQYKTKILKIIVVKK